MATERGFDRLVNFSDAIVAIAATLLVLPLVDLASATTSGQVDATIREAIPQLLIFVLSFLVVTRFWFSHHRFFEGIDKYSSRLMMFNLVWLLGIVVMPFTSELIAKASSTDRLAVAAYLGTMLWIAFGQLLMSVELFYRPELLAAGAHRAGALIGSTTLFVMILIAFLIGLIWPEAGPWSLFLIVLVRPITTRLKQRLPA